MCVLNYRLSWHYHFGRIVFALALSYFGFNIMAQGRDFYFPLLHAWRRMVLPDSKNRISPGLTYEDVFEYVLQVVGGLMMLGAALLALNKRVAGGLVLLLPIFFMLATQDNPMLIPHTKPVPKTSHIRYDDLARHLSLLGGILFLMVVPPVEDAAEENDHGKKKNKKKTN